jgi:hypothetical protein
LARLASVAFEKNHILHFQLAVQRKLEAEAEEIESFNAQKLRKKGEKTL